MFGFTFTTKTARKGSSSKSKAGPITFDIAPHHGNPNATCGILVKTGKERLRQRKACFVPYTVNERKMFQATHKVKAFETFEEDRRRLGKIPFASRELAAKFEDVESREYMRAMLRNEIRN